MKVNFLKYTSIFLFLLTLSCTFTQKIKDGEMAFDRKQYSVAIDMLSDEFERTEYQELKARKAFLIAESFKAINDVPQSIEWYKNAFDLKFGDKALEELAYALKKNEQYREAVNVFQALQERGVSSSRISAEINECTRAAQWVADKENSPYFTQKIKQNSAYSDYAPVLYNDQLVFTSDRKNLINEEVYKWTGNSFSDLYVADNLLSTEVFPFDPAINSPYNDGTATFNSDFTEIIFTRCISVIDDDYCKLMVSNKRGASWTEPRTLDFVLDRVNYGHPSLHQGDSILFFTAQMETGFGGYDIYYTLRTESGWIEPMILSDQINSIGDEKFPFVYEDTLYFASDGWPGMGGLDIFKSSVDEEGYWSPVENLKPPINSGADDFGFIIDIKHRKEFGELRGYFSSSRKGSNSDDIYAFNSRILETPVEDIVEDEEKEPEKAILYLAIKTQEYDYLVKDVPESGILGKSILSGVDLRIEAGGNFYDLNTSEQGFSVIDLVPGMEYVIKASKEEYLSEVARFTLQEEPKGVKEKTYNVNILLEKIFPEREIVLENIYYDFNESYIRDDAKPALNELATLLNNNPNVKIDLFSHTDCRGTDEFNINLSQARAKSAVDYLVSVGIENERMNPVGLGESKPAINCYCETCTEAEHQENRRTSFKIVEY